VRSKWHARISGERAQRVEKYREKMLGAASLWQVWRADLPQGKEIESIALRRLKQWASFLDPEFQRAQHVSRLALQLYDGLPKLSAVRYSPAERTILQVAGLLHGVGSSAKGSKPEKATFRLITRLKPPVGWSAAGLKMAGAVARFYRGALPRTGQKALLGFTPEEKRTLLHLAGILRLAEALGSDHTGKITQLKIGHQKESIVIAARGYSSRDRIAEKVASGRHLLEVYYRQPVLVKKLRIAGTPRANSSKSQS
jgi:exopolyphosphatase/pppGpp-phosphohydrolase